MSSVRVEHLGGHEAEGAGHGGREGHPAVGHAHREAAVEVHHGRPERGSVCPRQVHAAREAKVSQLGEVAFLRRGDKDVLRLEVPEDDLVVVQELQGQHDARGVARGLRVREPHRLQLTLSFPVDDQHVQVLFAQLHQEDVEGHRLEDVDEADDEGMVGYVQRLRLAHRLLGGPVLLLNLHGVVLTGPDIGHPDDLAEAAGPEDFHGLQRRDVHGVLAAVLVDALEDLLELLAHALVEHVRHEPGALPLEVRARALCLPSGRATHLGPEESLQVLEVLGVAGLHLRAFLALLRRQRVSALQGWLRRSSLLLGHQRLQRRGRARGHDLDWSLPGLVRLLQQQLRCRIVLQRGRA
mmetsp:Transcript_65948/g.193379  ORF Transcript_65948/g.193379 Transcript_65948/m.193379 type:complete len:353 (+) Transcript_65948:898-1956(+)